MFIDWCCSPDFALVVGLDLILFAIVYISAFGLAFSTTSVFVYLILFVWCLCFVGLVCCLFAGVCLLVFPLFASLFDCWLVVFVLL